MIFSKRKQHYFQQLTKPWRERLYGVALRQAGSREVAEDWTQEALLRAWRSFSQLGDEIAVYAWLLKVLDHVIADDTRRQIRRHQLAPVIAVDDAELQAHACSAPGPFEQALQQQTHEQVTNAVQDLPQEFSRVILLRDFEGLSYREVADILDIPQGTVMSRLSRGRRMLAKALLKIKDSNQSNPGAKADAGAQS